MRATAFISLLVVAFWSGALNAQCWEDIPLIRKDTFLTPGMYVIEPAPGTKAKVIFETIAPTIREDFTTVGVWTNQKDTGDPFLNRTVSFSNTSGAYLFLNFYGRKIELYTATAAHHGSALIQINQEPEKQVSFYSPSRVNDTVVFSHTFDKVGTNTIKVKVLSGWVVVDYFKVYE